MIYLQSYCFPRLFWKYQSMSCVFAYLLLGQAAENDLVQGKSRWNLFCFLILPTPCIEMTTSVNASYNIEHTVCACMLACTCVCASVCMHMCMCKCVHAHVCVQVCACTCLHACVCVCVCKCVSMHACVCGPCVCMPVCVHMREWVREWVFKALEINISLTDMPYLLANTNIFK